jgi:hypothetical protein
MFNEPYDTSLLRRYNVKQLTEQLETSYVQGNLHAVAVPAAHDEELTGVVVEVLPGNDAVDLMEAPKLITTRDGVKIVIDSRATKSVDRHGDAVRVTAPTDYQFALREAILTYLWQQDRAAFSQLGELPIRVYARWVSDALVRRLGLDDLDKLHIQIAAAFFYVCGFSDGPMEEGRRLGVSTLIARSLSLPLQHVVGVIDKYGYIADLSDFVSKVKTVEGASVRTAQLSVGLIYELLKGSWFGARKSMIVTSALEYPPTFLAMLLSAYNARGYHSAFFSKTAVEADRKGQQRAFTLAMNHISRGLTDE